MTSLVVYQVTSVRVSFSRPDVMFVFFPEVIPPSRVIMEKMSDSEVQLSWFGVKRKTVMGVDVVWCKVYPAVSRCQVHR